MSKDWHIRAATQADSTGLTECMQQAYAGYLPRMGGRSLPPMDVNYAEEINGYPTWVAFTRVGIVGGLIMVFTEDKATLANIAVHPDNQGQGIGAALLSFAETQAKERYYRSLKLATHVLLEENLALYHHLGWKETDRNETTVWMEKIL